MADAIPPAKQYTFAIAWCRALKRAGVAVPAYELYQGRAFKTALKVARAMQAELAIISAGLGIVLADTLIPSYDLTVARGAMGDRILGQFNAFDWWERIARGPFSANFGSVLKNRPFVLACLTRSYAPFVVDALMQVPVDKLRIFGAGLNSVLPASLVPCVMPYDDRLEALDPGARSDFAQRALLHYVSTIKPSIRTAREDAKAVRAALSRVPAPPRWPKRKTVDDDEVRRLIRRLLPKVGYRKNAMLRHIRRVEGWACEQGRFWRLYAEVIDA